MPNLEIINSLNFLDVIIAIVLLFYAFEGYSLGFIAASFDFLSFILSFFLGLRFYGFFANFLLTIFPIPYSFAKAIGFFTCALIFEIAFSILFRKLSFKKTITKENRFFDFLKNINHLLGIIPGALSSLVLLSFLLTLIISLPVSPILKQAVSTSKIGAILVSRTGSLDRDLNNIFGGAINDTLNFLTIEPQSDKSVNLNFKITTLNRDEKAENQMLLLVNKERTTLGLSPLVFDSRLADVARVYAEDLLKRGYFSHYSKEGLSPFDRMAKSDIVYSFAGENLAFAPNVELAMQGLMQSPGHRANILSPNFHKIGIGVIEAGIYGEMFIQEFTD